MSDSSWKAGFIKDLDEGKQMDTRNLFIECMGDMKNKNNMQKGH